MAKIKFPLVKNGVMIVYPDPIHNTLDGSTGKLFKLFADTEIIGNTVYADYSGLMDSFEDDDRIDTPVIESKLVDMGELSVLLPSSVLVNVQDISNDITEAAPRREAATQILAIIYSSRHFDVFSNKFSMFMDRLVDHAELSQEDSDTITETLKEGN